MSICANSVRATEPDPPAWAKQLMAGQAAINVQLMTLTKRVDNLEDAKKEYRSFPGKSKDFDAEFNTVLEREWKEWKEREQAKRVACLLKSLIDRYGDCCDDCNKSKTKSMSFLRPASYTRGVICDDPYVTSTISSSRTTLVTPACYTTEYYSR